MNQRGKEYYEWIKTRRAFIAAHPPNHQGYYACYLCPRWIPQDEITLDHIVARSRAPHLRHEFSNLAFACGNCNEAKGSTAYVNPQLDEPPFEDELQGIW